MSRSSRTFKIEIPAPVVSEQWSSVWTRSLLSSLRVSGTCPRIEIAPPHVSLHVAHSVTERVPPMYGNHFALMHFSGLARSADGRRRSRSPEIGFMRITSACRSLEEIGIPSEFAIGSLFDCTGTREIARPASLVRCKSIFINNIKALIKSRAFTMHKVLHTVPQKNTYTEKTSAKIRQT